MLKGSVELFQLLIIANYFLLVFANVLLFSFFDSDEVGIESFNIISVVIGKENSRKLIVTILSVAIIFSLVSGFAFSKWIEAFILILMNITFLVIILFPAAFKKSQFLGLMADSVFLYPFLLYWLH